MKAVRNMVLDIGGHSPLRFLSLGHRRHSAGLPDLRRGVKSGVTLTWVRRGGVLRL